MIVDSRGRLFGKISLLDLMALLFLLSLAGTVAYAVHITRHWSLQITSLEPKQIVAGPGRTLMMKGTGFDQSTSIQIGHVPARTGVYFDESTIGTEINEEIEPGVHRIIVRDGRGRYVVLPDAVEVIWNPRVSGVTPRNIYNKGKGTQIEILGSFFTRVCTVRVGDQPLNVLKTATGKISAQLGTDASLALGQQPVTVTNEGGQSLTLEEGITVLPAPEVDSVAPDRVAVGETVDLAIRGRHLREGTIVWLEGEERPLGEAEFITPEFLRIRLTAIDRMRRVNDLLFEIPDGPKVIARVDAVTIENAFRVFVVAEVLLDERSRGAVAKLKETLDWKLKRPPLLFQFTKRRRNFNSEEPLIEILLPARLQMKEGKFEVTDIKSRPLRSGHSADFTINGMELSGTVVGGPFVVFSDDFFMDKKR